MFHLHSVNHNIPLIPLRARSPPITVLYTDYRRLSTCKCEIPERLVDKITRSATFWHSDRRAYARSHMTPSPAISLSIRCILPPRRYYERDIAAPATQIESRTEGMAIVRSRKTTKRTHLPLSRNRSGFSIPPIGWAFDATEKTPPVRWGTELKTTQLFVHRKMTKRTHYLLRHSGPDSVPHPTGVFPRKPIITPVRCATEFQKTTKQTHFHTRRSFYEKMTKRTHFLITACRSTKTAGR